MIWNARYARHARHARHVQCRVRLLARRHDFCVERSLITSRLLAAATNQLP